MSNNDRLQAGLKIIGVFFFVSGTANTIHPIFRFLGIIFKPDLYTFSFVEIVPTAIVPIIQLIGAILCFSCSPFIIRICGGGDSSSSD